MKVFRIIRIALASWAVLYFSAVFALALLSDFQLGAGAARVIVVVVLLSLGMLLFALDTMRRMSGQPRDRETAM